MNCSMQDLSYYLGSWLKNLFVSSRILFPFHLQGRVYLLSSNVCPVDIYCINELITGCKLSQKQCGLLFAPDLQCRDLAGDGFLFWNPAAKRPSVKF